MGLLFLYVRVLLFLFTFGKTTTFQNTIKLNKSDSKKPTYDMKKFIKEYWIPILIGGTCTPMIRYAEKSYGEENKWFLWLGFCLLILLYIIFSERAKAKKNK